MIGFNFDDRIGYFPTDWNLEQLRDSGDFVSGSTPSSTNENYWGGDITWLVPSDLTALSDSTNYIYDSESKITVDGFNSCSTNMLPIGSLCLSSRATIGEAIITGVELCTNQGFVNIIPNEKHHALYLLYWVKKNKNYISRYAAGTTFLEIGRRTFKNLKIALPKELPEQKAIAGILFKVDEATKAVENSIKAAERLKKSLMQNLLTGKLKPDGRWRSEDEFYVDEKFGKVPKGWHIVKGNKITTKITKGQSPKWQGFDYQSSGILFVTSENVKDGHIDISEPKYLPIEFNEKIKNSQLKNGDVLINIVGASIGRCAVYNFNSQLANTNQAVCVFRTNEDNDSNFIAYYLQSEKTQRRLLGSQVETARANLSLGDFRKFKFIIPEERVEQLLISEQIGTVNSLIHSKQSKIRSLKTLKTSLMQNLLSGKVRMDVGKINKLLEEV